MSKTCELIGTKNRFDSVKSWTCLELPVKFIHKSIGEWLCKSCAYNLLHGFEDIDPFEAIARSIDEEHSEIMKEEDLDK